MVTDHSPVSPTAAAAAADSNGGVNSPQSRPQGFPSPWASVVRGDSEQISSPAAAPSSPTTEQASALGISVIESSGPDVQQENSDVDGDSNESRARRPAWNRPLNGVVEAGSVMGGAVSWPALSESTRPVPRSLPDSNRPVSDGSASSSQAPIIAQPPQRQANTNVHNNSAANNSMPTRPRSRNRGGGSSSGSGPSQGTFNRPSPPAPPPFPVLEVPYGMVAPPMMDTSLRGSRPVGGLGGSQSHISSDHSSQRNTSRRGNYGPRPRGDGPYHNNHGGRRNQDRRDFYPPPQYMPPPLGYMPSPMPPGAGPFMAPPPVRVFPGQMGFEMPSPVIYFSTMPPESFRGMPMGPPPLPMPFAPANENPSTNPIVSQIDYYFSDDNLVKDNFLRSNMDDQGWVPISLIASFRRVQQLTRDIPVILEALRHSAIVEVQGDRVRRRNEWRRWVQSSGSHTPDAAPLDSLASSLQDISLNDSITNANGNMEAMEGHTEMATGGFLPEELSGQSRLGYGEDTAEEARSISV